ncbi:hypothetical protein ACFE04_015560 [Oxalis oulophora]
MLLQLHLQHVPIVWAKYYPSLLNKEVVISSIYGDSWTVSVKEIAMDKIVFYGQMMKRFIERFKLKLAFTIDFERIAGSEFMIRIRDDYGVEIDYSPTWLDSRMLKIWMKNIAFPTLCTIFSTEHVVKCELSRINVVDDTICLYGDDMKKFTQQYNIKNGSRIILHHMKFTNSFAVKIVNIDGVEIDYGNTSSIEHSTCLSALQSSVVSNAEN